MTEPQAPEVEVDDSSVDGPRERAGTLQALAAVTAIALVVTGGIVTWMRLAAPAAVAAPEVGLETEVPTTLAGGIAFGEVPAEIQATVEEPVVGAVLLDELPPGMGQCGWGEIADPQLERAFALPGALVISQVGVPDPRMFGPDMGMEVGGPVPVEVEVEARALDEAEAEALADLEADVAQPAPPDPVDPELAPEGPRWRETCVAREEGGGWITDLNSSGPADDHGGFGASMTCCDGGFATALTEVRIPDEVAWALQDRGAYWLAYPVEGATSVPVTWRYRESAFGRGLRSTHVLLLDPTGEIVEDRYIDV